MSDQIEDRYCAFIDILGFKELVSGIRNGDVNFETIKGLLKQIHQPHDPTFVGTGDTDFQVQSISDAVVLSTRYTVTGLAILFDTIERLSLALLQEGYFTRGGLCRGLLYHDPQMVFGEALIQAYRMESEIAKYPRILLTKDVVDGAKGNNLPGYFNAHIRQSDDGPFYLHVLSDLESIIGMIDRRQPDTKEPTPNLSRFEAIRNRIQERFSESVDNPRHFEKVQWYARYFNEIINTGHPEIDLIMGPGVDTGAKWGP
jgi:hypothetical protein